MASRKILLIGMLDSIHVGRWISQFEGTDTAFVLYPSKKFRSIHPLICKLLSRESTLEVKLHLGFIPVEIFGYFDFLIKVLPIRVGLDFRSRGLRALLKRHEFDFIHALEIQGAGYLLSDALSGLGKTNAKKIVTNYGSDIYYFAQSPEHRNKIVSVLQIADYYSAECLRDYTLARELGFMGIELPCIPNAGGFTIRNLVEKKASDRRQIIVKCYGGQFGRGGLILEALRNVLKKFKDYRVLLYSVTDDLLKEALHLTKEFPNQIRIIKQSSPILHDELIREFGESRVYVGSSISDGISTSFLEAIVHGAFPIQTNTSCANEWIARGASGFISTLNAAEIEKKILKALQDDSLVNHAQTNNREFALRNLNSVNIKAIAQKFYMNI